MTGMAGTGAAGEDRGGEVTIPGAGGGPERPPQPERAANAGPAAEDEVTEWIGAAGPAAGPGPAPPAPAEPEGPWWPGARVAACTVVAGLVIGALAAVAFRHYASLPGGDAVASRQAAVRDEAASWIAQQVSRDATVSCDQVMCAALRARGFPAGDLFALGPASEGPADAGADVVVETPAVRALFGRSLDAAWAPAILASLGSRSYRITIRVIAPHGVTVYQALLDAGLAARKTAGTALLGNPRVTVRPAAAAQLAAGLVDLRLLHALAALARHQPVGIAGFGAGGPGASADIPLRFADLALDGQAAHLSRAAYLRSLRASLSTMSAAFHLMPVTAVAPRHGPPALRVQVTAPSPLG